MAIYRYQVVVDVEMNTRGAKGGANDAESYLRTVERQAVDSSKRIQKEHKDITRATNEGTKSIGLWGQAFKGAFIGAVAGMSFSLIVGGITNIAQAIGGAGISAVQAGARFQTTTKALEVFAGTTATARQELADIDEVARNTAGLRMESAEKGYTQLRALGFEAQQAKGFIKELGEEKILSGASDESLERIIFNFAQIASGGQKVSQELREILTQMPSLGNAFYKAFGSLDPKRIQMFFDADTNGAFKRLTDAMAQQKAASGGLEDAWGKLLDEVSTVGREFSEPILDPLTRSIKEMTVGLDSSKDAWREWGQYVGDVITGLEVTRREGQRRNDIYNVQQEKLKGMSFSEKLGRRSSFQSDTNIPVSDAELEAYRNRNGGALSGGMFGNLAELGKRERNKLLVDAQKQREQDFQAWYEKLSGASRGNDLRESVYGVKQFSDLNNLERSVLQSEFERDTNGVPSSEVNAERQRQRQLEIERKLGLEKIDSYYSQVKNIRENAFNLEIAQNQDNVEKVFQITDKNYSRQIKETEEFYNKKIELEGYDEIAVYKTTIEKNNALRDLENKQAIDRINFEREQYERRRKNLVEANDLQTREMEQVFSRRNTEIERSVKLGTTEVVAGYDELLEVVQQRENILSGQIRDEYNLRLQDKSLNAQEIINLEKQRDLDLADLQDQSLQKTREIEDAKSEAIIKNLTYQREITKQTYEQMSSFASRFQQDFFNPATFGGNALSNFRKFVLKTDQTNPLKEKINQAEAISKGFEEQLKVNPDNFEPLYEAFITAGLKADKFRSELNKIEDALPEKYKLFADLASQIGINENAFDKLNEAILKHRQLLDTNDAQREIEYWEIVIKNTTDADKNREATFNLNRARNSKERLEYNQNIEKAEQYRHSIEGINAEIQQLLSNDPQKTGALKDTFTKGRGEETINLLERIKMLEFDIASPDINAQYRVRAELLQHIVDLRDEETDALIRLGKAQIDAQQTLVYSQNRADAELAEFLTDTNITDVVSDARINALTTAYDALGNVIGKVADKFGIFGDVIKDLLVNLVKLALNNLFMKMFFPNGQQGGSGGGFGGGQGQRGGFQIPSLSGILGGGGGQGGTPLFNPNAASGVGGNFGAFGGLLGGQGSFGGLNTGVGGQAGAHEGIHTVAKRGGGLVGGLAGLLPMLGLGIGSSLGGGGLGGIIGGAGGLLAGGIGTAFLAPSIFGVGTAAGSSAFSAAAFGLLTNPFTAIAAGGLIVGAILLKRNAARRRDEKTRNQAMVDAFKQIDDLIEKVRTDKIDGQSALSSFDQIRASYLEMANGLKDKKTRRIAIADVSRLDAKLAVLKSEIANQESRQARLAMSVPTFGDGGTLSKFAGKNYINNPLGYQNRPESFGYFPSAGTMARFNERGSEYILDAETTRNIGSHTLDAMRSTKGESFNAMRRQMVMPSRAEGGGFGAPPIQSIQPQSVSTEQPKIEIVIQNTWGMENMVEIVKAVISSNNGSPEQLNQIMAGFKKQGNNDALQTLNKILKGLNSNG